MSQDKMFIIDLDDSIFTISEKEKKEWRDLERKRLVKEYDFLDESMSDEEIDEKYTQYLRQEMETMSEDEIKKRDERIEKYIQEIIESTEREVKNGSS